MAQPKINALKGPKKVVARNLALLEALMRYILAKPDVLDALPDQFELVILPDDDPEICFYNLKLLSMYGSEGRPVVFARIASSVKRDWERTQPSIYVPLAA